MPSKDNDNTVLLRDTVLSQAALIEVLKEQIIQLRKVAMNFEAELNACRNKSG